MNLVVAGNYKVIHDWLRDNHPEVNPHNPRRYGFVFATPGNCDRLLSSQFDSEEGIICLYGSWKLSTEEWELIHSRIRRSKKEEVK